MRGVGICRAAEGLKQFLFKGMADPVQQTLRKMRTYKLKPDGQTGAAFAAGQGERGKPCYIYGHGEDIGRIHFGGIAALFAQFPCRGREAGESRQSHCPNMVL